MACVAYRKAKQKCIFHPTSNKCERCIKSKQPCSLSQHSTTTNESMHKVNGDKSHVVNVCIQGSTELTTASLIAPTRTPIQSQKCKYSTSPLNPPIIFNSITPIPNVKYTYQLKLGQRWSPPSHYSQTLWKPMPIQYIPPWHIFKANKPSSQRTVVAHKAASFYNSARDTSSNISRSNAHKRSFLKHRKQMGKLTSERWF